MGSISLTKAPDEATVSTDDVACAVHETDLSYLSWRHLMTRAEPGGTPLQNWRLSS